jgi:hypothetical protein
MRSGADCRLRAPARLAHRPRCDHRTGRIAETVTPNPPWLIPGRFVNGLGRYSERLEPATGLIRLFSPNNHRASPRQSNGTAAQLSRDSGSAHLVCGPAGVPSPRVWNCAHQRLSGLDSCGEARAGRDRARGWARQALPAKDQLSGAQPVLVGVKTITGMTRSVCFSYSANRGTRSACLR